MLKERGAKMLKEKKHKLLSMRDFNIYQIQQAEREARFTYLHEVDDEILIHYPSISIEDTLNELIYDTKPYLPDFKMPYDAFFIDKEFKTDEGIIYGIYMYRTFRRSLLKDNIFHNFSPSTLLSYA
jgi:hypothetical protein